MAKRPMGLAFNLAAVSDHPPEVVKSAAAALPVSQVTDNIFIGTGKDIKDRASLLNLKGMGITHILNVAKEVEILQLQPKTVNNNNNNNNNNTASTSEDAAATNNISAENNNNNNSNDASPKSCGNTMNSSTTSQRTPGSALNTNNNNNDDDDDALLDGTMTRARSVVLQVDGSLHFETEHIPLRDGVNANTMEMLDQAVAYLHEAVSNGGKVMVHCRRGVSRSPAVVVAYLMKFRDWTYEQSWAFVKERRNVIELNIEFHSNLKDRSDSILKEKGLEIPRSGSRLEHHESGCHDHMDRDRSASLPPQTPQK